MALNDFLPSCLDLQGQREGAAAHHSSLQEEPPPKNEVPGHCRALCGPSGVLYLARGYLGGALKVSLKLLKFECIHYFIQCFFVFFPIFSSDLEIVSFSQCNLEKSRLASHAVADSLMTLMRRAGIYSEIGFKLVHIAAFSCKARVRFLLPFASPL